MPREKACQFVSLFLCVSVCDLQHSIGFEVVWRDTVLPLGWLMCTRNTNLTRVFLRPMSVSPLRSSMSELRSFRIPAQSILGQQQRRANFNTIFQRWHYLCKTMEKWSLVFLVSGQNGLLLQGNCFKKASISAFYAITHRIMIQNTSYRIFCRKYCMDEGWNGSRFDSLILVLWLWTETLSRVAAHEDQQWNPCWCYRSCTGSSLEHDRVIINPACHQRQSWTLMTSHHSFKGSRWSKN